VVAALAGINPNNGDQLLSIKCSKSEYGLCEQIPGCNFDKNLQCWQAPLTWPAYVAFREIWRHQPFIQTPGLIDWAASGWHDVQIAYGLRTAMDTQDGQLAHVLNELDEGSLPAQLEDGTEIPRRLFGYQRAAVAWLIRQQKAILGDPQGNGKTPVVIRAIQYLKGSGQAPGPALVICRGAMLYDWADEIARWAPDLSVQVVTGTALKRKKALEAKADVYLIAWPVLRYHTRLAMFPGKAFVKCNQHGGHTDKTTAQCEVHDKELNAIGFSIVTADEGHAMKDAKAKQSRAAWYLMHRAEYAWPVTGTPVADNISDIWSIGHAIDPRGFPAKSRFIDLYAMISLDWNQGKEILDLKPETAPSFHATVQPLIRRIPRELARPHQPPRLPPVFRHPEMEPAQARAYKSVQKMAMADLESTLMVTGNDLVKFSRLCQLSSAMIDTADGEDPYGFTRQLITLCAPSNKVSDLLGFLEDNPGPLVVTANSALLIGLASARLTAEKIPWCQVTGAENAEAKHQATRLFQEGQARVIFITKAGSESITLTRADTIFFMQPDPSFLSRDQKIGRIDRVTQHNPVRVVYSITKGTVDERLFELGKQKEERAASVTRDPDLLRWIVGGDDGGVRAGDPAGTLF
jgi:SNF2-related domain/Helicase conserved C-terminal domain